MKTLKYHTMESPVGVLKLVATEKNLLAVLWEREKLAKLEEIEEVNIANRNQPILRETKKQLKEYFSAQRISFNLPLEASGTEFQKAVWQVLAGIPYGVTWTYKQVAERINRPQAVRAVGTAIGRNPLSIIIPCHRVIGSNGELRGFAGGLDRKETLLLLEKALP